MNGFPFNTTQINPTPNNATPFNAINEPYGWCLLPVTTQKRDETSSATYGDGAGGCLPKMVQTPEVIGPQNTRSVNKLDQFFLNQQTRLPSGLSNKTLNNYYDIPGNIDLQAPRPAETKVNSYITLASQSLHTSPDTLMKLFFSDSNINHLRNSVCASVKQNTTNIINEGVDIKQPNMDDMFYYMINIYQNYKIHNGSICFTNLKRETNVKQELIKLNSDLLQDYVSKMISQINMYVYYYKDASQLPEQLSLPLLTSMKGSKTLEYNTGFNSGNSIGIASYNQVGNIL
jgi:hypothetical protein